jgi:hypothetical protein
MSRPLLISWKAYQRRSDVLAEALGADVVWRASIGPKLKRGYDYVERCARDVAEIRRRRPPFVIAQTPPHVASFAPQIARTPYIVDAHNGQFQGVWRRLPGAGRILRGARLVLTHTEEADAIARAAFPGLATLVVRDPLRQIPPARPRDWVFVVATAGVDEPMDLLIDAIDAMPDVRFATTLAPERLPSALRQRVTAQGNLDLLGFLACSSYEQAIAAARAVVVLTNRPATQPSGACEALSAARPLVLSRTSTTERLFGGFATLVRNTRDALVDGVRAALECDSVEKIVAARSEWMRQSAAELELLRGRLGLVSAT